MKDKSYYWSMKKKKHQGIANPEYAKAMRDLRRSGASGTHADKRTRRARTRDASLRKDLREQE
jgi:hypothetical protein